MNSKDILKDLISFNTIKDSQNKEKSYIRMQLHSYVHIPRLGFL